MERAEVTAQEKKDMELLWEPFGGYPFQQVRPVELPAAEYDPITMEDAEMDLYLRTSLQTELQDTDLQLASLQREGAVPLPEMRSFLSAVILADQTISTEDLLQHMEELRPEETSPAALCLTEKLLVQFEVQKQQTERMAQQRRELMARQTAAQNRLIKAQQDLRVAEQRYRENPYD